MTTKTSPAIGLALTWFLLAAPVPAQQPSSPGIAALEQLRQGEIRPALERLGEVVDEGAALREADEDDLSPAAGGVSRALARLDSVERYDLLREWSLPSGDRRTVRVLTVPVPQIAPPKEFARLLGERPRGDVFPIAEVGGVRGLFCSGWMLARAADELGRLSRLRSELESLAGKSVPGADLLLLLTQLADDRGDLTPAADEFRRRIERLHETAVAGVETLHQIDPAALALAAAALEHEPLRPAAEQLLGLLSERADASAPRLRSLLRWAHATAVQRHRGASGPEALSADRLKYWVPVSGMTTRQHAAGGDGALWLVHEDHILHLAGSGNDVLFFRYPLTGAFTFSCETQEGGQIGTDGGLVYGGLQFEALGRTNELTVADADFAHKETRFCPFVRHEPWPTFNRVSIHSVGRTSKSVRGDDQAGRTSQSVRNQPLGASPRFGNSRNQPQRASVRFLEPWASAQRLISEAVAVVAGAADDGPGETDGPGSPSYGVSYGVNGHPVWSDTAAALRSPWLGLRSFGGNRPVFRNLRLTGSPVIPREIKLTGEGDRLRGWWSHSAGRTFQSVRNQPLGTSPRFEKPHASALRLISGIAEPWASAHGLISATTPSFPSSAWERTSQSSALRVSEQARHRRAKRSFAVLRSQAELGNEGDRVPPPHPDFSPGREIGPSPPQGERDRFRAQRRKQGEGASDGTDGLGSPSYGNSVRIFEPWASAQRLISAGAQRLISEAVAVVAGAADDGPGETDGSGDPSYGVGERSARGWRLEEGVLRSDRLEGTEGVAPRLLWYQRPLLNGEAISYEFRHEPGEQAVHPAVGRLVFLIEPDGVRIRWVTDGAREWTGLPADNAAIEPLNRRGPAELPLKENDWNRLTLARDGGRLTLTLEGVLIYERPIDFGGDHRFGLYHDAASSAATVRNVVMTGDWPESLPEELLNNPAAVAAVPAKPADRQVLSRLIGHAFLAANVRRVRDRAAELSPEERYEYLRDWVLPGADHADLRVVGAFTQTDPPPLRRTDLQDRPISVGRTSQSVRDQPLGASPRFGNSRNQPQRASVRFLEPWASAQRLISAHTDGLGSPSYGGGGHRGGELVSPVFDLIETAAQLGRLDELHERVADIELRDVEPLEHQWQQRALWALRALIAVRRDNAQEAAEAIGELTELAEQTVPGTLHEVWPETLVVLRLSEHPEVLVGDLLGLLFTAWAVEQAPPRCEQWYAQISSCLHQFRNRSQGVTSEPIALFPEGDWIPLTRQRHRSRGRGHSPARWGRTPDGEMIHIAGHQEEYLLYRSPLTGDFEVECDVTSTNAFLFAGGTFVGNAGDGKRLQYGTFRGGGGFFEPVEPSLVRFDHWVRLRAVQREGVCSFFIDGQMVKQVPVQSPWIGVRCWYRHGGGLRDVRITGDPIVPESIDLVQFEELPGWLQYYNESIGDDSSTWRFVEDFDEGHQIVGRRRAELAGMFAESLLRYQRPLIEDGSVEYEFYYEPGRAITHPALDRLALLLDPEGVKEHWITDGEYDPTDLSPGNAIVVPENRRGPQRLPLRENAWNDLRLSIAGEAVTLVLNGEAVYERELEPTNQRTFGLFRYADREVRVRNVIMRGDWPGEIPAVSEQPLADPLVQRLNAERDELGDVFAHDFGDGLDERYFQLNNNRSHPLALRPGEGIMTEVTSPGSWMQVEIASKFTLHGDYDLEMGFDKAEFSQGKDVEGRVLLMTRVADELTRETRVYRSNDNNNRDVAVAQLVLGHPDGTKQYQGTKTMDHSISGRLRLARRGETVYYLYAQGDSPVFRVIGQEQVNDGPTTDSGGIRLLATANHGGQVKVVFKDLTLRAERLTLAPPDGEHPTRAMFLMSPDGSDVRRLTLPLEGFLHLGSPDWSPDGRRIAMDMSGGSVTTAHIVAINADGSDPRDLGPGCMPSYSADGERIVFSQSGGGVLTMDADGSNRQTLERNAWGADWSPDGRWIAFGHSGNLTIVDMQTNRRRQLLTGKNAERYSYMYWNPGWSRDSKQIAFKARLREGGDYEVAVARLYEPDSLRVLYTGTDSVQAAFAWSPDDQQILFAKRSDAHRGLALFSVPADGSRPPELLAGQPIDLRILNCAWSPDGQHLVMSCQHEPEQREWPQASP